MQLGRTRDIVAFLDRQAEPARHTAGDEIPQGARIVAVCDAFSAMVQERPYQPGLTVDQAVEEIVRCAGTHFDPDVVAAFAAEIGSEAVHA